MYETSAANADVGKEATRGGFRKSTRRQLDGRGGRARGRKGADRRQGGPERPFRVTHYELARQRRISDEGSTMQGHISTGLGCKATAKTKNKGGRPQFCFQTGKFFELEFTDQRREREAKERIRGEYIAYGFGSVTDQQLQPPTTAAGTTQVRMSDTLMAAAGTPINPADGTGTKSTYHPVH